MDALAPIVWGIGGIVAALALHLIVIWRSRHVMRDQQAKEGEELNQLRREMEYIQTRETQKADPVAMGLTDRDGVDRLSGLRNPLKPNLREDIS